MLNNKNITFLITIIPLIFIILNIYLNNNIINPFSYLISSTGFIVLTLLIIIIALPVLDFLGSLIDRRVAGLMTFSYASMHLLIYFLDNISFEYLIEDILGLPYIQIGYLAFLLFFPLVFTSTVKSKLKLKNTWFKIHKLIYLIILLSFIHYYLIIKADYLLFLIYLLIFISILIYKQRFKAYE